MRSTKRKHRRRIEYLVKWVGYELHDATWESLDNLKNAQDAVKEFEESLAGAARS